MLEAFHPGIIDAGTDIVDRPALGELEGKGKELTDEKLLDNLLGGEARFMLRHLHHYLCQLGGGLAFAYLSKIGGDVLLINIYMESLSTSGRDSSLEDSPLSIFSANWSP